MPDPPIPKDANNFYHPETEKNIRDLVSYAKTNGYQVRVRGSGHSMPQAIFTDDCDATDLEFEDVKAPDGVNVNIMLDKYNRMERLDQDGKLVKVEAGIRLGSYPFDDSPSEENSLLYQLHHTHGLALNDLGGITHQTVGGFLMTGSSGGSMKYSVDDNIIEMRFIDGNGNVFTVRRGEDDFHAALTSLGLLGILSTVTFRCISKFNIIGTQKTSFTSMADVNIFSDRNSVIPFRQTGLSKFLKDTGYTRMLWWPQSCDQVQVWQAERMEDNADFERNKFAMFDTAQLQVLYSYLLITAGSDDRNAMGDYIVGTRDRYKLLRTRELENEGKSCIDLCVYLEMKVNALVASLLNMLRGLVDRLSTGNPAIKNKFRDFITSLAVFMNGIIDSHKEFQDYAYSSLPMDNSADDVLVPIMFTEIWVPLSRAAEVTSAIRGYFEDGDPDESSVRTGNNAWELYAAKPSKTWLSMSYSNDEDDWSEGAFRVDPFWFKHNSGSYNDLFRPIFLLLKNMDIPYRLHWGKIFPAMDDEEITAEFLVNQKKYPRLKKFLELREKKDPGGIFLNSYWRHWFGIPS